MSRPLVTALVRTYQNAATLPLAVASVLAQTMNDLECLIVDDGSSDATEQLVATFKDPRVRYVRHARNQGRAAARKTGLKEARGEFLGLLDADDWWYPHKLERQIELLRSEPELALVSTGLVLLDGQGRPKSIELADRARPRLIRFAPLRRPQPIRLGNAPSLLRIEAARSVAIDVSLPRAEDFYFLLQVLLRYPHATWSEPLYAYLLPEVTRHRAHSQSAASCRRIYAKYLRQHPVASLVRQGECLLKQAVYAASARLSENPRPVRDRGRQLTPAEGTQFERARHDVTRMLPFL